MRRLAYLLFSVFFITACGGGGSETTTKDTSSEEPMEQEMTQQEETPAESEMKAESVSLELNAVGETMATMAYEPTRLEVPAGAEVNLTLNNTASAEAMIHNVVFIQRGKQEQVSSAGLAAGKESDFVPADNEYIIAASELAQPGESVSFSFTAPTEPGTYQFICTYPGHTAMKGILLVQ